MFTLLLLSKQTRHGSNIVSLCFFLLISGHAKCYHIPHWDRKDTTLRQGYNIAKWAMADLIALSSESDSDEMDMLMLLYFT